MYIPTPQLIKSQSSKHEFEFCFYNIRNFLLEDGWKGGKGSRVHMEKEKSVSYWALMVSVWLPLSVQWGRRKAGVLSQVDDV